MTAIQIRIPSSKVDAAVQQIKNLFALKKIGEFDLINKKFSGGGYEGHWAYEGFTLYVWIDKRPTKFGISVPMSFIESAIRRELKEYIT